MNGPLPFGLMWLLTWTDRPDWHEVEAMKECQRAYLAILKRNAMRPRWVSVPLG